MFLFPHSSIRYFLAQLQNHEQEVTEWEEERSELLKTIKQLEAELDEQAAYLQTQPIGAYCSCEGEGECEVGVGSSRTVIDRQTSGGFFGFLDINLELIGKNKPKRFRQKKYLGKKQSTKCPNETTPFELPSE